MKAVIHVLRRGWSGGRSGGVVGKNEAVEVGEGEEIEIVNRTRISSAKVPAIDPQGIVLTTSGLAPRKEGAGIDLRGDYTDLETRIEKGQAASFSTQGLDGNQTFTITLAGVKP